MTSTFDFGPNAAGITRRSLLKGSAGATAAGVLSVPAALAQQTGSGPARLHNASHPSGTMSDRIYTVNPEAPSMAGIAENPANVPPPIGSRDPTTINVEFETREIEAHLDRDATFRFWTFNGTVPGPMIRAKVGDTVDVTLRNHADSFFAHNVDFHACTGPGGGAEATTAFPGEERRFRFKALQPGLFVYHCAVPPVAQHIANGMYGMILVEPEEGMPEVDREYYVMQGEIYVEEPFGSAGLLTESFDRLLDERASYLVFNGHVGALTDHYPLTAKVGETVRIYFGVGGPNYISSFHVIGEIFDRVYLEGSVVAAPHESVQTIKVAPGGSGIVEFRCEVPGRYVLVDHALSRVERGLAGYLFVEGEEQPEIFEELSET